MIETKAEAAYFIKDKNQQVTHILFRDSATGHKLVYRAEEISLEELAELIKLD